MLLVRLLGHGQAGQLAELLRLQGGADADTQGAGEPIQAVRLPGQNIGLLVVHSGRELGITDSGQSVSLSMVVWCQDS